MRKITQQAQAAFNEGRALTQSNTTVAPIHNNKVSLLLQGNLIATKDFSKNATAFTLAGRPTVTTRERLLAAGIRVAQHKGKQFYIRPDGFEMPIEDDRVYIVDEGGFVVHSYYRKEAA